MRLRNRLAFFLINTGIKFLPKEYRNLTFIQNCVHTNKITVEKD